MAVNLDQVKDLEPDVLRAAICKLVKESKDDNELSNILFKSLQATLRRENKEVAVFVSSNS